MSENSPDGAVFYKQSSKTDVLVVAFSSIGVDGTDKYFEFRGLLGRDDCSVLLLRDPGGSWYHDLADIGRGPAAVGDRIARYADRYRRVICLGYSMGGYAALLFGRMIGAETILALAPQTTLARDRLHAWGDHRWDAYLDRLACDGDARFLDLAPFYRDTRHLARDQKLLVCLGTGGGMLDLYHARHLEPQAAVHALSNPPLAHHALVVALRESGLLRALIDGAIAGDAGTLPIAERFAKWAAKFRHSIAIDPNATQVEGRRLRLAGTLAVHAGSTIACDSGAAHPVRLGVRLWPEGRFGTHQREGRFHFAVEEMLPGSVHRFATTISVDNLPEGEHSIVVGLVREGRFWFDELGFKTATLPISVDSAGEVRLAGADLSAFVERVP